MTPSELRADIYRLLDQVLETGIPLEIERKGRRLKIVVADASGPSKLERLRTNPDYLVCDPDEIVHMDWSDHWRPDVDGVASSGA